MAGYSQNDLMKMQQDATRRVMEMQQRAKKTVEAAHSEKKNEPPVLIQNSDNNKRGILDLINFKSLLKEQDTTLVAALLLMLSVEETDTYLLLALLYILM